MWLLSLFLNNGGKANASGEWGTVNAQSSVASALTGSLPKLWLPCMQSCRHSGYMCGHLTSPSILLPHWLSLRGEPSTTFLRHHAGPHTAATREGGWRVCPEHPFFNPCKPAGVAEAPFSEDVTYLSCALSALVTQQDSHVPTLLLLATAHTAACVNRQRFLESQLRHVHAVLLLMGFPLGLPGGTHHGTVRLDPGKVFEQQKKSIFCWKCTYWDNAISSVKRALFRTRQWYDTAN